jgi:hypothetical protein
MSLSSRLKDPVFREELHRTCTKPRMRSGGELLIEPKSTAYGLVGTAFDYLLRFEVNRRNPGAVTGPWVAEYAKVRLIGPLDALDDSSPVDEHLSQQVALLDGIVAAAKASSTAYMETGQVTDDLLADALRLAKLETLFRSWLPFDDYESVNPDDVDDLRALLDVVPDHLFYSNEVCVLNPEFNKGTDHANGADADLLVDDTLWEIKTTKSNAVRREHFDQLVAYFALARLYGVTGLKKKPRINKLSIYFSRYGDHVDFFVDEILHEPEFSDFLVWFKGLLEKRKTPRPSRRQRATDKSPATSKKKRTRTKKRVRKKRVKR